MTAKELDELERRVKSGTPMAYDTMLYLIAAARERDALLKVVEAAQAVYDSEPEIPYDPMDDRAFRVGYDEMLALEKALAQHREERDDR
jgi:hypothetical protein